MEGAAISEVGREWENTWREPPRTTIAEVRAFTQSPFFRFVVEGADAGRMKCLEVGCASAKFSAGLALAGHEAVALDYSEAVIERVGALRNDMVADRAEGELIPVRGAAEALPFPDESFDLVFNEGVVEHWLKREQRLHVLREMVRVTRHGGTVVVIVPNGVHPLSWFWHLAGYPGYRNAPPMCHYGMGRLVQEMQQAGLEIERRDGIAPLMSLWQWPRHYLLRAMADRISHARPEHTWPPRLRLLLGVHLACRGRRR